MKTLTMEQKMAASAWRCVQARVGDSSYRTFALKFPSLIHSSGLAQAVVFAARKGADNLADLGTVLREAGVLQKGSLEESSRQLELTGYLRLSRRALEAAGWLKRYVQALEAGEE